MRVLVVDDNVLIRIGLSAALQDLDGVSSVVLAENGKSAIQAADSESVDIVLLDVQMPQMDGLAALPHLLKRAKVIMLTHTEDVETVASAMSLGASGYIVHGALEPEAILAGMRTCLAGGTITAGLAPWEKLLSGKATNGESSAHLLSAREAEIMEIIATGIPNHRIAKRLFLSEKTIKNHVNSIFSKLGVQSRAEAIATWLGNAAGSSDPGDLGPGMGPGRVERSYNVG